MPALIGAWGGWGLNGGGRPREVCWRFWMMSPFLHAAITRCPACDYDLAGATTVVCPECGHEITETEVRFDARRRAYLEMTGPQLWTRGVVLIGLALFVGYGAPLLLLAAAFAGPWVVVRQAPALEARVIRRGWWLAAAWLQLLWVVPLLLGPVWDGIYYGTTLLNWVGPLYEHRDLGISLIAGCCGLGLGMALWAMSWRRMCRLTGLKEHWFSRRTRAALLLAIGLPAGVIVTSAMVWGMMSLLDRVSPGWYLN